MLQGPPSFDRIFVAGMPRGTTEAELRAAFTLAGVGVGVIAFAMDRVTGLRRGFAFVDLDARIDVSTDGARLARLRSATVDGQTLDIQGVPPRSTRWLG